MSRFKIFLSALITVLKYEVLLIDYLMILFHMTPDQFDVNMIGLQISQFFIS